MWALLVVGCGAGFIGLVFVLTSIHHWLVNPDRNVSLVLIPIGLVSIVIGIALLVGDLRDLHPRPQPDARNLAGLFIRAGSGLDSGC